MEPNVRLFMMGRKTGLWEKEKGEQNPFIPTPQKKKLALVPRPGGCGLGEFQKGPRSGKPAVTEGQSAALDAPYSGRKDREKQKAGKATIQQLGGSPSPPRAQPRSP